jgi:hypothetical protein
MWEDPLHALGPAFTEVPMASARAIRGHAVSLYGWHAATPARGEAVAKVRSARPRAAQAAWSGHEGETLSGPSCFFLLDVLPPTS